MSTDIIKMLLLSLDNEDIKVKFKSLLAPIIDLILIDIYPYIYISIAFIITGLLLLGIFIILIHHNSSLII